jgi:drug/metabolite transporter (DMT)-like permease
VAALLWGGSATLGKLAFQGALSFLRVDGPSPIEVIILAQTRTAFALLLLAPYLLTRYGKQFFSIPRVDILKCMAIGTIGIAASNFFYYYAIAKTTVATAIIVQYTAPVWVLIYMVSRGLQHASWPRVVAVAMAVLGAVMVIGTLGFTTAAPFIHLTGVKLNVLGVLAALGASFSFAFYNVAAGAVIGRRHRWSVFLYALVGSVVFWLIINPPWKVIAAHYTPQQWLFLLIFSITSMLLPFSFYFAGLQYLDATRAIVTSCLEPVFAILFAATFMHEPFGGPQIIGMAAVIAGTIIIQKPEKNAA